MQERLQKIISRAGIASRRAGEELILAGRVRVNGRIVTELGAKADAREDKIEVDGQRLMTSAPLYVVLHKPRNVVSTLNDPEGRPTVADYLRATGARLYPVGRLDFATSGVLLATNDGDFANAMLHPRGGVPKTYVIKVAGLMEDADLDQWRNGVQLDDGITLPAQCRRIRYEDDKTWIEVTIREGRNQQIRRMGEATGFPVRRLARVSFAGITHEGLRPGDVRTLTVDELLALRKEFGVPKRVRSAVTSLEMQAPTRSGAQRPERPRRTAPSASRAEVANNRRARAPRREGGDAQTERPTHRPAGMVEQAERPTRRPARAVEQPERPTRRPAHAAPQPERPTRRPARAVEQPERPTRRPAHAAPPPAPHAPRAEGSARRAPPRGERAPAGARGAKSPRGPGRRPR